MVWYHFIAYFFAGLFLANGIPHYVLGAAGRKFPTPFANPPGKGESSAMVNVMWGLANFTAGYLLLQVGSFSSGYTGAMLAFVLGILFMSFMLAKHFGSVYSAE